MNFQTLERSPKRQEPVLPASHIGAARVERHRLGRQTVLDTYDHMREVLQDLRA